MHIVCWWCWWCCCCCRPWLSVCYYYYCWELIMNDDYDYQHISVLYLWAKSNVFDINKRLLSLRMFECWTNEWGNEKNYSIFFLNISFRFFVVTVAAAAAGAGAAGAAVVAFICSRFFVVNPHTSVQWCLFNNRETEQQASKPNERTTTTTKNFELMKMNYDDEDDDKWRR